MICDAVLSFFFYIWKLFHIFHDSFPEMDLPEIIQLSPEFFAISDYIPEHLNNFTKFNLILFPLTIHALLCMFTSAH